MRSGIYDTPFADKEKIIDEIVSKHKDKIVLIDLWATWCGPCIQAMKEMDPLKKEWINKGVVFVYIAGENSPKGIWKEKIDNILGEHYYLTDEEWNFTKDSLNLTGVPSYLIFDKQGILKHKFTGFPGVDEMKKMIDDLQ